MRTVDAADEGFDKEVKSGRKSRAKRNVSEKENSDESPPKNPVTQPTPGERRHSVIHQLLIFINLLTVFILSTQMKLQTVVNPPLLHLNQLVIML